MAKGFLGSPTRPILSRRMRAVDKLESARLRIENAKLIGVPETVKAMYALDRLRDKLDPSDVAHWFEIQSRRVS